MILVRIPRDLEQSLSRMTHSHEQERGYVS
jgi:hypothetical protein